MTTPEMTTPEKVAYLKGLCDGLGVDKESKDGRILNVMLEIFSDLASEVDDLQADADAAAAAIDDITEDLSYVEDAIDELDLHGGDDDDDWDDMEDCDYNCDECGQCDSEDCDGPMYEVTCPNCGDSVTVDESILSLGKIECPGCGNILEFDLDKDED